MVLPIHDGHIEGYVCCEDLWKHFHTPFLHSTPEVKCVGLRVSSTAPCLDLCCCPVFFAVPLDPCIGSLRKRVNQKDLLAEAIPSALQRRAHEVGHQGGAGGGMVLQCACDKFSKGFLWVRTHRLRRARARHAICPRRTNNTTHDGGAPKHTPCNHTTSTTRFENCLHKMHKGVMQGVSTGRSVRNAQDLKFSYQIAAEERLPVFRQARVVAAECDLPCSIILDAWIEEWNGQGKCISPIGYKHLNWLCHFGSPGDRGPPNTQCATCGQAQTESQPKRPRFSARQHCFTFSGCRK